MTWAAARLISYQGKWSSGRWWRVSGDELQQQQQQQQPSEQMTAIKHGSHRLSLISLYLHSEGVKTSSEDPPPSPLLPPDDEGGGGSGPSSPRSVACKSFPVRLDKQQRQQWRHMRKRRSKITGLLLFVVLPVFIHLLLHLLRLLLL